MKSFDAIEAEELLEMTARMNWTILPWFKCYVFREYCGFSVDVTNIHQAAAGLHMSSIRQGL
jgi:hypothetical protein